MSRLTLPGGRLFQRAACLGPPPSSAAARVDVTLITEGTYPYVHGGVSVWCDQLVRGMPDVRFQILGITGSGQERRVWELPPNVTAVTSSPLWGPDGRAAAPRGRERRRLLRCFEELVVSLVDPQRSAEFSNQLYALGDLARQGISLTAGLRSQEAIDTLQRAWNGCAEVARSRPTLRDAADAVDLLEHALRPLAAPVPTTGIAHCVTGGLGAIPALMARRFHRVPFLLSEHGIYLRERYLSYQNAPFRWPVRALILSFFRLLAAESYRCADLVSPCNQYNRRWEERAGCPPERIRTVYNGVSPEVFPLAGPEPDAPTLSWAGRVDPIKDLETLIHAFAQVREVVPDARLRLFGGVPAGGEAYQDTCERLADVLNVGSAVSFEGRIDAVRHAYEAGTVVVLSSISEGFPFSLLEAMACGRATVSTDVGGVREAVGDAGLVVPPGNPDAMARAVISLLQNSEHRAALGRAAHQRVLDRFTVQRMVATYRGIYRELTGSRHPESRISVSSAPPRWKQEAV